VGESAVHHDVTILSVRGRAPKIDASAWIAPGCKIIGDVEICGDASIWYNCVIRGDVNSIRIGARSNIQDGCIIHCDSGGAGGPGHATLIGEDVLVGHMAVIHGATLMRGAFVGIAAVAMDGAVIEPRGMLAAGGMLTPHKRIETGQLWGGTPAKHMRPLSETELTANARAVAHYVELAREHRAAAVTHATAHT
jgi:gamma-carbonic anhydrase